MAAKVQDEPVVAAEVAKVSMAGVNGPIACTLTQSSSGTKVGTPGGPLVTVNNNSSNLVYWKLGSTSNNASAYIFAEDDGSGTYKFINSNGAGAPLLFSTSSLADPITLDIDNDDLTSDPRVFYLFASGLTAGNQAFMFPSKFWADKSYSVQETSGEVLSVLPHTNIADMFELE